MAVRELGHISEGLNMKVYANPRIVAFIPAHNEEGSIRNCLEGLADQKLPPEVMLDVIVIADNCTDRTEQRAREAAAEFGLRVQVINTMGNKQRKVGALNAAWKMIYGDVLDIHDKGLTDVQEIYRDSVKAILGMDADSRLAPNALIQMWEGLMSARNIGGVMAKYTMLLPDKKSKLPKNDPHYEEKIKNGQFGGPITRWWVHQQKQDMASWLLDLQYHGGSTYVLGGQATLFRPEALQDVVDSIKLDGPWQNDTDVEDMLLTWQLQKLTWKTLISPTARCFVDSMKTYHTYRQQRNKWKSGTVGLLTNRDLRIKTKHIGRIWRDQIRSFIDLITRVLFIGLLVIASVTHQYYWSWIWLTPVVLASIINIVLAVKTPMHRPIDVVLAGLLISPEVYMWVNLITFTQVWMEKLSVNKKDGWVNQYNAEKGATSSKLMLGIVLLLLSAGAVVFVAIHFRPYLMSTAVQTAVKPYLMRGWRVLTCLTIISTLIMLHHLWTLRGKYTA